MDTQLSSHSSASVLRPNSTWRTSDRTVGLGLIVLVCIAYLPAFSARFIWDDDAHILYNTVLRSTSGLGRIWTDLRATPQYYPLTQTTFWLEYHLWGVNPLGYHAVNILLHALCSVVLWRILRKLAVPGALAIAALFAVHPVNVETVAWITERKNILSYLFYLLAFATYWRMLDNPDESRKPAFRWPVYLLALLLFLLSLLSKTVSSTLPAAILLVLWWRRGKLRWRDVLATLPMFAMGAAFGGITHYLEAHRVGAIGYRWDFTFLQRVLIAGRALWFYAAKLLLPINLCFNYERWTLTTSSALQWVFPLSAIGVLAILFVYRKRLGRGPLTGVLLFCGTLTPALGFFNTYPMLYSFVADHFVYAASIGLLGLLAAVVVCVLRLPNRWQVGLGATAVIGCSVLTFSQSCVYFDLRTLWSDVLARNPRSWLAATDLSVYHLNRIDRLPREQQIQVATEVRRLLMDALTYHPDNPPAQLNLGTAELYLGHPDIALAVWSNLTQQIESSPQKMQAYTPSLSTTYSCMGRCYLQNKGNPAKAEECYRKSVALDPTNIGPTTALAQLLSDQGKYKEAHSLLQKALISYPYSYSTWTQAGDVYRYADQPKYAIMAYTKALGLNPDHLPARSGLAVALAMAGRSVESQRLMNELFSQEPRSPEVLTAAGVLLARDHQIEAATRALQAALQLQPDYAEARRQLHLIAVPSTQPATAPVGVPG